MVAVGHAWQIALFVVGGLAVVALCLVVHELGHVAAAKVLGFTEVRMRLWPPIGTSYVGEARRLRLAAVAVAGALANFGVAAIVWTLMSLRGPLAGPPPGWELAVPWVSLISGAANLVPIPRSDGWQIVRLATHPASSAEEP